MAGLLELAMNAADQYGVPRELVQNVMMAESRGRTGLVSPKGALGPMQLMPDTARGLGVDPNDPAQNIDGGVRYLKQQLDAFGGNPALAAAAYNAGPGAVRKYGGVPPYPETQAYVQRVAGGGGQQQAQSGADIFGLGGEVPTQPASGGGNGSGEDIFSLASEPLTINMPVQDEPQGQRATTMPEDSEGPANMREDMPTDNPNWRNGALGGFLRGVRDPIDAGAQLLTRGVEAVAPAGSSLETWAKGQREQVEAINQQAEQEYRQEWRGGDVPTIDGGRIAGNIAATLPLARIPMLNPATVRGGAGFGAAAGALNPVDTSKGQGYGQQLAQNMALGAGAGAAGSALGAAASRILRPVDSALPASAVPGMEAAQRLGVDLTPGQITGSRGLRQFEEVLAKVPGSADRAAVRATANQEAINKAAAETIGQDSAVLSESVLAKARQELGNSFKALADKTNVSFGDEFIASLVKTEQGNKALGAFANPEIASVIDKGLDLASSGTLTGKAYQTIRSRVSERISDAFKGNNSEVGQALKSFRDALDTAARSGMDDAIKAAWDQVRQQWANLRTLEKGMVIEAGNVQAGRMPAALRTGNPQAYREGTYATPLMDIARYAETFKPTVGDSGTATRSLLQNILSGNVGSMVTGPVANMADRAMFSPLGRQYLQQGLLSPYVDRAAVQAGGGLLGVGTVNTIPRR